MKLLRSESLLKVLLVSNILVGVVAITALVITVSLSRETPRVAYVHNGRLLTEYDGIREGRSRYEEKVKVWQANVDTLYQELMHSVATYQERSESLSPPERLKTEELIEAKRREFVDYKQAMTEKAQAEDEELTASLLGQIDSFVMEFGDRSEYDLILGVNQDGNVLYGRDAQDITEEVLAGLNAEYAGK